MDRILTLVLGQTLETALPWLAALLLVLAAALYLEMRRRSRQQRAALGLRGGTIVAADSSRLGAPTLRSHRLGLVGRPDHLLRVGRMIIPVEHKPTAHHLHRSHVLHVAAECLLVQEVYGVRPAYGAVVLHGGIREPVPFTPALERELLETMQQMRQLLEIRREPGRDWVEYKCRACAFNRTCWSVSATKPA